MIPRVLFQLRQYHLPKTASLNQSVNLHPLLNNKVPKKTIKSKFQTQFNFFSLHIEKLKQINHRLRNKIKELNEIVEKAIEKANLKKLAMSKNENTN